MEFTGLLGLVHLILLIYAVVKIAQSGASTGGKVLWILLVLLAPIVGFIIWLLLGPKGGANTV